MESQPNPNQFNHPPWGWDHSLPPPLPPPNFGWQPPDFPPAVDHFHHPDDNNFRPDFHHHDDVNFHRDFRHDEDNNFHHHDDDFHGGADQQFYDTNPHFDEFGSAPGTGCSNKHFFPRKRKLEYADGGNCVKLYVVGIPRTVTEEDIHGVFEEYGNVVEVVVLNEQKTGQHQEYCFVKYASTEEADRAILALHNQFTFPGAMAPIQVRYAYGKRERLGLQNNRLHSKSGLVQHDSSFTRPANEEVMHRVYVDGLNKEASRQEVLEIFSSYGDVADVYIMRNKFNERDPIARGFVGFTHKYMAVAAINGLNGSYVMRGCDRPLAVRFADPKKPKSGDIRSAPNSVDMRGSNMPNVSHMSISSASTQESATQGTHIQSGVYTPVENQWQGPPYDVPPPPCQRPFLPSQFPQAPLQQSQTLLPFRQLRDVETNVAGHSFEPPSCASLGNGLSEAPVSCDWSEHICPDGFKYYFNCVTCESRWEKPEEFAFYEQHLRSQWLQNCPSEEIHQYSAAEAPSEEVCQTQVAHQRHVVDSEKPQLPISCSVEHSHEQALEETSPSGGPTLVN